jgi:hypothetical protein
MRILYLALLLTACTPELTRISLTEIGHTYPKVLPKSDWAYWGYGYFVSRDTEFKTGSVKYKIVIDNTELKNKLIRENNGDEAFKREYPDFVMMDGKVNCETKDNTYTLTRRLADLSVITSAMKKDYGEIAQNLCYVNSVKLKGE